jgi:hypothetical protein
MKGEITMKSMLIRAIKTFAQAFIGSVTTVVPIMIQSGFETWTTMGVAACLSGVAAGVAAVMNLPFVKKFFKDYGEADALAELGETFEELSNGKGEDDNE